MGSGASGLGKSAAGASASGASGGVDLALKKLNELDSSALSDMIKSPIPKISRSEADKLTKEWSRIKQKDRKKLPEETVNVSDIVTWQNLVNKKGVTRILKGENVEHQGSNVSPIYAMFSNGKYVLMDGNHRVTADILLGKKTIRIKVKR